MTFRTCSYEKEIQAALKSGHWPAGCTPELRDHVDQCDSCNDLVLLTETFQTARRYSPSDSDLPAGLIWWRAQLRMRRAADDRVSAPVTIAQLFAWAISLVAAVGFVVSQYHHGLRWASWFSDLTPNFIRLSPILNHLDWSLVVLIPTMGALVLLAGLIVFLVSEKT
ncbi:MAG TPA: hypothetical protein VMP68_23070 [Candidatus Eisenbacteria bacterium]|nr:hypothetical protein [Candidatus Eisenbacteria bacterium]